MALFTLCPLCPQSTVAGTCNSALLRAVIERQERVKLPSIKYNGNKGMRQLLFYIACYKTFQGAYILIHIYTRCVSTP
ncbi:hypothetical protein BDW75DRAFT_27700 [Aspergillus navahoensis]